MRSSEGLELVRLRSGAVSVRSAAYCETMHPGLGPIAEANALYVDQLRLAKRLRSHEGEFVVWDVGLGAAANALAVLRAIKNIPCCLRLISFDDSLEPLRFALANATELDYLADYANLATRLVASQRASICSETQSVNWEVCVADFPSLLPGAVRSGCSQAARDLVRSILTCAQSRNVDAGTVR